MFETVAHVGIAARAGRWRNPLSKQHAQQTKHDKDENDQV
jgi:hypothetical protein